MEVEKNIEEGNNSLVIGSMLEEFEILSVLGAGGFGITYKVRDTNLNKLMVIKEYMPSQFASRDNKSVVTCISTNIDDFEWGMNRFMEEAKVLSEFEHPNVVKARRLFKANNTAYFVMDYYEGETLEDYIKSNQNHIFTQDEILSVIMPIIEGLKVVHNQGFLHRDIAPDNIFLCIKKAPILIDFGASRHALGTKSQNISTIVKHGYSPPEQYTSKSKQDETTDLYAISAVIYEMITGDRPPESTHRQTEVFDDNKDPIEDIVTKYKDRFKVSFLETISQGLKIRQKDRIQTIEEFQKGLVKDDINGDEPKYPIKAIIVVSLLALIIGGYFIFKPTETVIIKSDNKPIPIPIKETNDTKNKVKIKQKNLEQTNQNQKICSDSDAILGLCKK